VLTIDDLPDDALLEIFDLYIVRYQDLDFLRAVYVYGGAKRKIESWQLLIHVCRRWRGLVFGSPRRLDLQIFCYTLSRSARKSLDVWPALPLIIQGPVTETSVDNVIAELEHSDRISQIGLGFHTSLQIEKLWTAIQVPFPELTALCLQNVPNILPDSFLGGSATRLRYFSLDGTPFPGLPKLLSSATHLVHLHLHRIPHSGYISPETMATCLSLLTSLEFLQLEFEYPTSYPDLESRRPFPPTRSVLPTLTSFSFQGANEYLEEFVARIDAPQLYQTTFIDIDFDTPGSELNQFIGRTLTLGAYDEALLFFEDRSALVRLRQSHPEPSDDRMVEVEILGYLSDRQLSTLAQICALLRLLLTMENLYIDGNEYSSPVHDIEDTELLELLLPFTAVKNLYLSEPFMIPIAHALGLTGGRITEVLPALQNVFLEGFQPSKPVHEGIAQFISARQLTDHPVAISAWDRDLVGDESLEVDDW
jgi:hypothetical protein